MKGVTNRTIGNETEIIEPTRTEQFGKQLTVDNKVFGACDLKPALKTICLHGDARPLLLGNRNLIFCWGLKIVSQHLP